MSDQDRIWLEETFPKYYGLTIKGEVYQAYLNAERIFNNWVTVKKRDCSCQYRALKNTVDTQYNNWLQANGKK